MAFEVHNVLAAGAGLIEEILGAPGVTFEMGDMVNVANGIASKVAAAGKGTHIVIAMFTPISTNRQDDGLAVTSTGGERLHCLRVEGGDVVVKSKLTGTSAPTKNGTALNANATVNNAVFTDAAMADDALIQGTCYIPGLGTRDNPTSHFRITDHVKAGNDHTLTLHPNPRRAPTTGDTIYAVPFSKGFTAVKFDATTPHQGIGTAAGDDSGGHAKIEGVDLANLIVYTSHPDLE